MIHLYTNDWDSLPVLHLSRSATKNSEILSFLSLMGAFLHSFVEIEGFSIYFSTYTCWWVLSSWYCASTLMGNGINHKKKCWEGLKKCSTTAHQGAAKEPEGQITAKHLLALSTCILPKQAPQQWLKPMFDSTSLTLTLCRWSKKLQSSTPETHP